jgi:cytochrome b6-f complex iron-sulfur subunit
VRFLRPRAAGAGGALLDVGPIQDYAQPVVATRWVARHGVWVVSRDGRVFALEARCTHLGCTPRWEPERGMFQCPCHGSRFTPAGEVLNGPAVHPLARFAIAVEHDQVQVDLSTRAPSERAERDPRFSVAV